MNNQGSMQEYGQLVIPDAPVSMTASTAVVSAYVNILGADIIECILWLAASVTGATSVGTIEILAAADASGAGAVAVKFSDLWKTLGATTIKQGTGIPTRIEQLTSGIRTPLASYSTLGADGDKQQQFVIPIRARQLPAGKPYVAVRFTAGAATARNGLVAFFRRCTSYGAQPMGTSIFA
jgi:hypothetical protein